MFAQIRQSQRVQRLRSKALDITIGYCGRLYRSGVSRAQSYGGIWLAQTAAWSCCACSLQDEHHMYAGMLEVVSGRGFEASCLIMSSSFASTTTDITSHGALSEGGIRLGTDVTVVEHWPCSIKVVHLTPTLSVHCPLLFNIQVGCSTSC